MNKNNFHIDTIRTGSFSMNCAYGGHGPGRLVLLPGLSLRPVTSSAQSLTPRLQPLFDDFTVYLFDRPSELTQDCSIHDLAEDTFKALQLLGIEKACLFGASQGGMLAQCMALEHPDLAESLVLASTAARLNPLSKAVLSRWIELAGALLKKDALARDMICTIYSGTRLERYKKAFIAFNTNVSADQLNRFRTLARASLDFDLYGQLDQLRCPVLVLGSEGDQVLTAAASREIAVRTKADVFIYDSSYDHAVYDEAPDFWNRVHAFAVKNSSIVYQYKSITVQ